jgi:hypothetical protein
MQPREYHRVRICLPARLRWATPFGQKIELSETLDVSRGGLLLSARELHSAGASLWVTFPYDASLPDGQPEVLARVVRCGEAPETIRASSARVKPLPQTGSARASSAKPGQLARDNGISDAPALFAVAICFDEQTHLAPNGNRTRHDPERRASPRRELAVPVRIRPEHIPWFEEAMTLDFSSKGLRFRTQREYALGETLKIALRDSASTPWSGPREFRAHVVRVSPAPDGIALDVSVCRA